MGQGGRRHRRLGPNWKGYGQDVALPRGAGVQRKLVTDPQTSGGLLVACAPRPRRRCLPSSQAGLRAGRTSAKLKAESRKSAFA
jgi:selenide,water dikinase